MARVEDLKALLARVESSNHDGGPDLYLEAELLRGAFGSEVSQWPYGYARLSFNPTARVDDALDLTRHLFPDFWVTSGLCSLSGHASIGPDYNGPASDRLREVWFEDLYHCGFDADLKPGDGRHRQCRAILSCVLQALIAQAEIAAQEVSDGER